VDQAVHGFLQSEALHPADFTRADGVMSLKPELVRRFVNVASVERRGSATASV
jgi:hypothetical protein